MFSQEVAGGDFRTATRDRNRISGVCGWMRLVLERSVEWRKVYALFLFDSEVSVLADRSETPELNVRALFEEYHAQVWG